MVPSAHDVRLAKATGCLGQNIIVARSVTSSQCGDRLRSSEATLVNACRNIGLPRALDIARHPSRQAIRTSKMKGTVTGSRASWNAGRTETVRGVSNSEIKLSNCCKKRCQRHNDMDAKSNRSIGWGGRDRTSEWRNQNPLPYRLATPQRCGAV